MISSTSIEEKRQRAQSHFEKKELRMVEAAQVADDHRAKGVAEAAKTVRLRALRLAKEALDAEAAQAKADRMAAKSAVIAVSPDSPKRVSPRRTKKTNER